MEGCYLSLVRSYLQIMTCQISSTNWSLALAHNFVESSFGWKTSCHGHLSLCLSLCGLLLSIRLFPHQHCFDYVTAIQSVEGVVSALSSTTPGPTLSSNTSTKTSSSSSSIIPICLSMVIDLPSMTTRVQEDKKYIRSRREIIYPTFMHVSNNFNNIHWLTYGLVHKLGLKDTIHN